MSPRLHNLLLTLRCFARAAPHFAAARRKVLPPRRAVVVQRAALGDMVCTTPVFAALKRAFPSCRLTVVGTALNLELLAGNSDVDEYIVWRNTKEARTLLRRRNFDIGILVAPSPDSLATLLLAGVPRVIAPRMSGKTPFQTLSYRLLLRLCEVVPHALGKYAPREYLRLLEPLGVTDSDTTKKLAYSRGAVEQVARFFAEQKNGMGALRVGIAPGAGATFKCWPAERFGMLAEKLWGEYRAQLFIVGSAHDTRDVAAMKRAIPQGVPYTDTTGRWSVDELKAFIAGLHLFVSADTGPVYLAEAFGVPTVDIVGPVDERDQPPRGNLHAVVFDESRTAPVTGVFTNKFFSLRAARKQAEAISVEQVLAAVRRVLAASGKITP